MKTRSKLVWLSICVAVAAGGAALAAKQSKYFPHLVPTKMGYGASFDAFAIPRPTRSGILMCTSSALNDCSVANMQLIWQENTALKSALATYAKKYAIASGPDKGKINWSEPEFGVAMTLSPADFAQNILDNGCYIASLTTVENALFADLPQGGMPFGTPATLNGIAANQLFTGSKVYNQLLWQYERWADTVQPNPADHGQTPLPNAFIELDDVAASFAPPPTTTYKYMTLNGLSDSAIVSAMKKNQLVMFAFSRYAVSAGKAGGKYQLTLTYNSHHKVPVFGFQPGSYPLTLNDVGDGKQHRVHLTTSLSDLKWSIRKKDGTVASLSASDLVMDPNHSGAQPILVYQGADGVTINDPSSELLIVEEYWQIEEPIVTRVAIPHHF